MRIAERADTGSVGATFSGTAWSVEHLEGYSISAALTGDPSGTLKLQCCITNPFTDNVTQTANPDVVWVDVSSSSQSVSASGNFAWNVADVYYRGVRVVYTRVSGTGTYALAYWGKGTQS